MQEFINQVFGFFGSLFASIGTYFSNISSSSLFETFIDKKIFDGTLLSMGLTWHELFIILIPTIVLGLFIIFIFKLVIKAFGLFRI